MNSAEKGINLTGWSSRDFKFSIEQFEQDLITGIFDNGVLMRTGLTLKGDYLVVIDFDGWNAVLAWFGSWEEVLKEAIRTRIEWHLDKGKIHVHYILPEPIKAVKFKIPGGQIEFFCMTSKNTHQCCFTAPSIHEDGNKRSVIDVKFIKSLGSMGLLALKAKINLLHKDYISTDEKRKYNEWLDDPHTKIREGEGRHDAIRFKVCSYYWKYGREWLDLSDEDRLERAWNWSLEHCVPPRTREHFEGICKWAKDKFRVARDKKFEEIRNRRYQRIEEHQKEFNKAYRFSKYPQTIQEALKENIWVETREGYKWLVGGIRRKVIYKAHRDGKEKTDKQTGEKYFVSYLQIDDTLIRCLPTKVTKHENMVDFGYSQSYFTIEFKDSNGKHFTLVKKSIGQIIEDLISRGYVVPSSNETKVLLVILGAIEEDGKLQLERSVDFEGFFYADGDIHRNIEDFEKQFPNRTVEDCKKACDFLEQLSYFYKYNNVDRRDMLAASIKWTIIAPYNFVLKQLIKKYMNAINFQGEHDGGKSTLSDIMLEIHGHKTVNGTEQSIYDLSAGSANTDAKLGNAVSKTTFPIMLSEFGTVEKYGRDEKMVETFKNIIDRPICRHGRKEGIFDYPFPSLSPLIINGNAFLSKKPEVVKRLHLNISTKVDRHSKDSPNTIAFNKLMSERRHELKIIGDWTLNYIWNNRTELLLSKKYDAYELMIKVMKAFYDFAGVEMSDWMNSWIKETALEELDVDETEIIRSTLFEYFDESTRYLGREVHNLKLESRIPTALCNDHVFFVRRSKKEESEYYITSAVFKLFKNVLPDTNLKQLGEKIGLEYKHTEYGAGLVFTVDRLKEILL